MEVNLNVRMAGPVATASPQPKVKVQSGSTDAAEFSGATALNQSFSETPEVRPEMVSKARALVSQPEYPPAETMRRIAVLLAFNLDQGSSAI